MRSHLSIAHQMLQVISSRIMPRTTLDIDTPILEELKRIQDDEGTSLGALASSLLADALAARKKKAPHRQFHWNARSMQARVSLEDKDAIWAVLDQSREHRSR